MKTFTAKKTQDLKELASYLKKIIKFPSIILLQGELGAGKTALTKAIAEQYGLFAKNIKSPTFTLLNVHKLEKEIPLYHLDLYRLAEVEEFFEQNLREIFEQANFLAIIEWPEKITPLLKTQGNIKIIEITIEYGLEMERHFHLKEH